MRAVRLSLVLLLAIGAGGGLVAVTASTSAQTPAASEDAATPTYLFVLQATGGSLASTGDGEWTLSLTGVSPQTIYFTDRPAREAGTLPTTEFLDLDGLFTADNPPNAAVVVADPASEREDVLVVALRGPAYDPAAGTLSYTVAPVEPTDQGDALLRDEFGHVTLFIDGTTDDPTDPYQFCLAPPPLFCF
jgi:hypothetical protein